MLTHKNTFDIMDSQFMESYAVGKKPLEKNLL